MKLGVIILAVMMLSGCASKHAYMSKPANLAEPQWSCDGSGNPQNCMLIQMWKPSQLTPVGCVAHTVVTAGHVAWECRKPKNGKIPTGGKWIWK
jgi:hypothetical protein